MHTNINLPYHLAFARFQKIGARRLKQMKENLGDVASCWRATREDMLRSGLPQPIVDEFIAMRPTIHPEAEAEAVAAEGISVVTLDDPEYPPLLAAIYDPPDTLFFRGALPHPNQPLLSIVGSRRMSSYGARTLERLIPDLVAAGVGIVSGLALGCDGHAHHLTVEHEGRTFGVLPGGCNHGSISPSTHQSLASRMIAAGGGVLTEYPIGTGAFKGHFPVRNRIIAGLTKATLVIEAAVASGSLLTVASALDYNREVMAVPGPIDAELSEGPNKLLRQGAHVVTSAADILAVLGLEVTASTRKTSVAIEPQNANEAAILPHLAGNAIHVDDLSVAARLPLPLVLQTLTALELRDAVEHTGGNRYHLRR